MRNPWAIPARPKLVSQGMKPDGFGIPVEKAEALQEGNSQRHQGRKSIYFVSRFWWVLRVEGGYGRPFCGGKPTCQKCVGMSLKSGGSGGTYSSKLVKSTSWSKSLNGFLLKSNFRHEPSQNLGLFRTCHTFFLRGFQFTGLDTWVDSYGKVPTDYSSPTTSAGT